MAIIYNIEDYRNKKIKLNPEEEFRKFFEDFGTWDSPEEEMEFYHQQFLEDEAELREIARELPESWKNV